MKLLEALELLRQPLANHNAPRMRVALCCGFTPLHVQTFLHANLRQRADGYQIEIDSGLYGDLCGNLERIDPGSCQAIALIVEWSDLDPRLGYRQLGGWRPKQLPDIVDTAQATLARLETAVRRLAGSIPVTIVCPTLPLPPVSYSHPLQGDAFYWQLESSLAQWAFSLATVTGCRILNPQALDRRSNPDTRLDLRSLLLTGFPYSMGHSSQLGALLASLLVPQPPAKGLITDLDDTLWSGILGEIGVDNISWSLEHHTQQYGVYQQFLQSLADAGTLLAIASKNEAAYVESALQRKDILLARDSIFPVEAHWGRKSESVGRILQAWNIGPEAVIFIDDSPMEVAEVQAAFPTAECLTFPKKDPGAIGPLLEHLRSRFGKSSLLQEDEYRLRSLKAVAERSTLEGSSDPEEFFHLAEATITIEDRLATSDGRALDLINKTNQFNLNGKRLTEAEWAERLAMPGRVLLVVSYRDRFGPLGRIAMLTGIQDGESLSVDAWVMSCRAFSRRIEYACLDYLLRTRPITRVHFDYQPTPRNRPIQGFLTELLGQSPAEAPALSPERFAQAAPNLYHHLESIRG